VEARPVILTDKPNLDIRTTKQHIEEQSLTDPDAGDIEYELFPNPEERSEKIYEYIIKFESMLHVIKQLNIYSQSKNETRLILKDSFFIDLIKKELRGLLGKSTYILFIKEIMNENDDIHKKWDSTLKNLRIVLQALRNRSSKLVKKKGETEQLSNANITVRLMSMTIESIERQILDLRNIQDKNVVLKKEEMESSNVERKRANYREENKEQLGEIDDDSYYKQYEEEHYRFDSGPFLHEYTIYIAIGVLCIFILFILAVVTKFWPQAKAKSKKHNQIKRNTKTKKTKDSLSSNQSLSPAPSVNSVSSVQSDSSSQSAIKRNSQQTKVN